MFGLLIISPSGVSAGGKCPPLQEFFQILGPKKQKIGLGVKFFGKTHGRTEEKCL